jgi:hypothetical protein
LHCFYYYCVYYCTILNNISGHATGTSKGTETTLGQEYQTLKVGELNKKLQSDFEILDKSISATGELDKTKIREYQRKQQEIINSRPKLILLEKVSQNI